MRQHLLSIITVITLLLLSTVAQAQVRITVDEGNVRGIPTAIVPFKVIDGTSVGTQVDQIVAADLRASGKFEPIPTGDFLSFPSRPEEIRFKDWRFIDAEVLVIGELWKLGSDQYEIQFRMYDVARQQEIGSGKRIPNLREKDLRTAAHIVSDNVYAAFTGKPGAFNSRIAYISKTQIEYQRYRFRLMVADWDGYGAQEVYGSWRPLLSPSWSPDNKKIAFVAFSEGGSIIRVLDLNSGEAETIASFKGINSAPAWSPDGKYLAYSTSRNGSPDVYLYDTFTRQHTRLNTHYAIDTEPAFSPDGQSILFTSSRGGKPQVYSMSINGDATQRISFNGEENANGSYDYDGQRIVMVHEGGQIAVMNEENGEMTPLTFAKFDESPSFSPNGDMVLYATEQAFQPALMVASSDGRVLTRLEYISGDVREPAWSSLKQ